LIVTSRLLPRRGAAPSDSGRSGILQAFVSNSIIVLMHCFRNVSWRFSGLISRIWPWLACLCVVSPLFANDSAELKIDNIRIGLGNVLKVGCWTSIQFDVTGPGEARITPVIRCTDPEGHATLQPLEETILSSTRPTPVRGLVKSGRLEGSIQIQLWQGDKELVTTTLRNQRPASEFTALRQMTQLWVSVGQQPLFSRGLKYWKQIGPQAVEHVELEELGDALWTPEVLDGVDVLILNGDAAISGECSEALRGWVQQGGRLIVPVGDGVDELARSPLAGWLPIMPSGQVDISKLTGFNDLVPRSSTLRTLATLPAGRLDRNAGQVIASGLSEPLALRAAYGAGQVVIVAVKLDDVPLSNWEAESQAHLAGLLAGKWSVGQPLPGEQAESTSELNPAAVTELQSQINFAVDSFPGITRTSHWGVMGWIVLFAAVIGPLDYLLVHLWLRRPEWTWGTLTVWSLLAAAIAIVYAGSENDHSVAAQQLEMLDLDATTGTVRSRSWAGFYSTGNRRCRASASIDPALKPDQAGGTPRISWVSRPVEGFRGMYRSGGIDPSQPQYQFLTGRDGIENMPARIWSTVSLACEWDGPWDVKRWITSELTDEGTNRLSGRIVHHFPVELTDWFLAYGSFIYFEHGADSLKPPAFPADLPWDLSRAGSNLLRGRLMALAQPSGSSPQRLDMQFGRSEYDVRSTSPETIGLAVTFYGAIGGRAYTTLGNQGLERADLSQLLELDRAILFGRLKLPTTEIQLDGTSPPREEQSVLVRVILPVHRVVRSGDSPTSPDLLIRPK
jgi:hypothetical protein